jgi:MFS family permease
VVFQITGSAWWVGVSTAAQFLPGAVASPFGGHLADSFERRTSLRIIHVLLTVVATLLWVA